MNQTSFIILLLTLVCSSISLLGQSLVEVNVTGLNQVGAQLEVFYDIRRAAPNETFQVSVEVFDVSDEPIPVVLTEGDLGLTVDGGTGKKIMITLQSTFIKNSIPIYVKVFAKSNLVNRVKYWTSERMENIGKTIALPGWAQTHQESKFPFWTIGLIGYGALGGAIYFNRAAQSKYDDYLSSDILEERSRLRSQALDYESISEVLAYGGALIWTGYMTWTMIQKSGKTNSSTVSIEPASAFPGISLTLKL